MVKFSLNDSCNVNFKLFIAFVNSANHSYLTLVFIINFNSD